MTLVSALSVLTAALLGAWALALLDRVIARRLFGGPLQWSLWLDPPRDALRHLFKRWRATEYPDLPLWLAGPVLLAVLGLAALSMLPPGPAGGVPVGAVLFIALLALVLPAVFLTGWGPNSKYPLLAGWRFVGLMLAYEVPLAITVVSAALPAGSLSLEAIVAAQQDGLWNLVLQPIGFLLYLICALALGFRAPFAVIDAKELAGGIEAELAGAPLLIWRLGREWLLLALAGFGAVLFLGGGTGPWLPPAVWLGVKTLLLAALLLLIGQLVAQVRLRQFMSFAWVALIPLSLANLFLTGLALTLWPDLAGGR